MKGKTNLLFVINSPDMTILPWRRRLPEWLVSHFSGCSSKTPIKICFPSSVTNLSNSSLPCPRNRSYAHVLMIPCVCSSVWSFYLGWAVRVFHPSGLSFGLTFCGLALFPGTLDFPTECQPHQTHAPHLHPWSGRHDPPGGPE